MPNEVNSETHPEDDYVSDAMADRHERLQQARLAAGYPSAREAARAFGWNENTYKSHEGGGRGLSRPGVADRYAAAFRVDVTWLMYGRGEGPKIGSRTDMKAQTPTTLPLAPQPAFAPIIGSPRDPDGDELPVYGRIVETESGEAIDYSDWSSRLPPPRSLTGVNKAFGVYVVGESCADRFRPGDLVWVHPGKPPTKGCGVVIVFKDQTAGIGIYVRRDANVIEIEHLRPAERIKIPRSTVEGVYRIVTTDHA